MVVTFNIGVSVTSRAGYGNGWMPRLPKRGDLRAIRIHGQASIPWPISLIARAAGRCAPSEDLVSAYARALRSWLDIHLAQGHEIPQPSAMVPC